MTRSKKRVRRKKRRNNRKAVVESVVKTTVSEPIATNGRQQKIHRRSSLGIICLRRRVDVEVLSGEVLKKIGGSDSREFIRNLFTSQGREDVIIRFSELGISILDRGQDKELITSLSYEVFVTDNGSIEFR